MTTSLVVFFTANERDSIFHQYRTRRLKKKRLQCKTIFKIKQIRSEYLAQKREKSEFSNKFQTAFRNTYVHILYITVFVISCRSHFCENFELHYSESGDFAQYVKNGYYKKSASETEKSWLTACCSSYIKTILTTFRNTYQQGPSLLKNFGGDKPYCVRFDDATMFTQP